MVGVWQEVCAMGLSWERLIATEESILGTGKLAGDVAIEADARFCSSFS
jgi:hypothetical protein